MTAMPYHRNALNIAGYGEFDLIPGRRAHSTKEDCEGVLHKDVFHKSDYAGRITSQVYCTQMFKLRWN